VVGAECVAGRRIVRLFDSSHRASNSAGVFEFGGRQLFTGCGGGGGWPPRAVGSLAGGFAV